MSPHRRQTPASAYSNITHKTSKTSKNTSLKNTKKVRRKLLKISEINFCLFGLFSSIIFLSCVIKSVDSIPSDRQRHEILLLDSLGRRSAANQDYDTFMDMLGRSKEISDLCFFCDFYFV